MKTISAMADTTLRRRLLLSIFALGLSGTHSAAQVPKGWWLGGDQREMYVAGTDRTVAHGGSTSGLLESRRATVDGFGTLAQTIDAKRYRLTRLRLTAAVRTREVTGWAGLWMRVDEREGKPRMLAFDNMKDRPLQGTADWRSCSIVLDVSERAGAISFGVILHGGGTVWLDDVVLEKVDATVPLTDMLRPSVPPSDTPLNLDFER